MKILLSPAKKLDFEKQLPDFKSVDPVFEKKTSKLLKKLKKLSPQEIGDLMKLSPNLSTLNYDRFQAMGSGNNEKTFAGFAFNGEVYTGLDIASFSDLELKQAEEKIIILSGLYGVLRINSIIEPYRLEMGTRLQLDGSKNLYEFWGEDILNTIEKEEQELIINLASNEYNKAAKLKQFRGRVVTPNFKEFKEGNYKTVMVYAKKYRGAMAKWIIQNNIEKAEQIKNFNIDGYLFNESLSSENDWIFTR